MRLAGQLGDLFLVGVANHMLGRQAVRLKDFAAAHRFYAASLTAHRQEGDLYGAGNTLWALADLLAFEGNFAEAKVTYQEARKIFQELNDRRGLTWSEIHIGTIFLQEEQLEAAAVQFESALVMAREFGEINGEIDALNELGLIAVRQGRVDRARALIRQSLTRNQRLLKERFWASDSLIVLSGVAQVDHRMESCARLLGMSAALDNLPLTHFRPIIVQVSSAAQTALGEEAYLRFYAEGQAAAEQHSLEALIQSVLEREFPPRTS